MSETTDAKLTELLTAKIAAQQAFEPLGKSGVNTFFNNRPYSTLTDMLAACEAALAANQLNVTQTVEVVDGQPRLVTYLYHTNGACLRSDIPISSKAGDPQSMGSWLTYMRRYGLAAMLGLESEMDDDGNAGAGNGKKEQQKKEPPKPPQAPPKTEPPKPAEKKTGLNYAAMVEDMLIAFGCKTDEDRQAVLTFCVNEKCKLDNWKKAPKKVHDAIQAKCATVTIDGMLMQAKLETESKERF